MIATVIAGAAFTSGAAYQERRACHRGNDLAEATVAVSATVMP